MNAPPVRPPGLLGVAVWADGHQEWWSTNIPGGSANFLARCEQLGREPLSCSNGMWRFDVPASDGIPPPPLPPDAALSPDAGRRWNYRDKKCPHWCTPRKEWPQ